MTVSIMAQTLEDYQRPLLTVPDMLTEESYPSDLPYSSITLHWKYHEEPALSQTIEAQVGRINLSLAKVERPGFFGGEYVGACVYKQFYLGPRTMATTLECGEELQPNTWYRLTLRPIFLEGSPLAERQTLSTTRFFKTMAQNELTEGYRARVHLEVDKLSTVSWDFLAGVEHHRPRHHGLSSEPHTLENIYERAGVKLSVERDEGELPPDLEPSCSDKELHALAFGDEKQRGYMNSPPPHGSWHVHTTILLKCRPGLVDRLLGGSGSILAKTIRYPNDSKGEVTHESIVSFLGHITELIEIRSKGALLSPLIERQGMPWAIDNVSLHNIAHELGHVLYLYHSDAGDWRSFWESLSFSGDKKKPSIMSPGLTSLLDPDWQYDFSEAEANHFYQHDPQRWRPYQRPFSEDYECHEGT